MSEFHPSSSPSRLMRAICGIMDAAMMQWKQPLAIALLGLCGLAPVDGARAQNPDTPYWASIDEGEARMRTGPSTEFPVKWIYRRKHMPVKVVLRHSVWRKVEDVDGDQGWLHVRLLSPKRTALVVGGIADMRAGPDGGSHVNWRAEPGVVGLLGECSAGWCLFDVAGKRGYVAAAQLWGEEALKAGDKPGS